MSERVRIQLKNVWLQDLLVLLSIIRDLTEFLVPPQTNSVPLDKSFNFSGPHFPHLYKGCVVFDDLSGPLQL